MQAKDVLPTCEAWQRIPILQDNLVDTNSVAANLLNRDIWQSGQRKWPWKWNIFLWFPNNFSIASFYGCETLFDFVAKIIFS